ncbi:U-box domain-containing protein 10 [Tetrabaena socialis]|uniref:U-box domain-containing protein 10 n=1 Tax=Tetrabaena socialis TaxID=47790 RepID=A0A2J8AFV4_9CHLO|nr:U-box domain-containing protein 10 [Tetrabaena socialis]|eukprot:PNH11372.1 U-box domain-containing protein 10 [Tetrabaena socialis]
MANQATASPTHTSPTPNTPNSYHWRPQDGWTALHMASEKGPKELVEALLRAGGAAIVAKDKGGRTALHCASKEGHKEVVEALLRAGADVATKDNLSVGVEQHSELMQTIRTLRADLTNIPLEIMRGLESQAATMREHMERLLEEARVMPSHSLANDALLQRHIEAAVVAGLHKAGVLKNAAGASRMEAEEIATALMLELDVLRHDKRVAEEQYLEQVMAVLALQDVHGNSSGSSSQPIAASTSPPHDLHCPITLCLMRDPVTVETGHAFERQAIMQHLAISNINPFTNKPLQTKALTPNIYLRNAIESWLNKHGMTHEQADAAAMGMQTGKTQPRIPPSTPPLRPPWHSDLACRPARTVDERVLLDAAKEGRLLEVDRLLSDPATNPNVQDVVRVKE